MLVMSVLWPPILHNIAPPSPPGFVHTHARVQGQHYQKAQRAMRL